MAARLTFRGPSRARAICTACRTSTLARQRHDIALDICILQTSDRCAPQVCGQHGYRFREQRSKLGHQLHRSLRHYASHSKSQTSDVTTPAVAAKQKSSQPSSRLGQIVNVVRAALGVSEHNAAEPTPESASRDRAQTANLAKEDRDVSNDGTSKLGATFRQSTSAPDASTISALQRLATVSDDKSADSATTHAPSLKVRGLKDSGQLVDQIRPSKLDFRALQVDQAPVSTLAHGLDRVLFNPGVYRLQDAASRVYNFNPFLENIMPISEFNFSALKPYKTSSQDTSLSKLAKAHGGRYVGSTSSMTGILAHFHFLLSNWRPLNLDMLSRGFKLLDGKNALNFTELSRAPSAAFLRYKDGIYSIDGDKQFDTGSSVLSQLGHSLEKLLTRSKEDYQKYRKDSKVGVSEEERAKPETYQFSAQGKFLTRAQLDAHDPRLPGTGTFDIKTRAVVSIRMQSSNIRPMVGYQILSQHGNYESYEREYHDMLRSTLLKYSLQARMGKMDGIFMAYHNVEQIFGFQYLNMMEIDSALHSQADPTLGDQEFRASLDLLETVFDKATARFPEKSLRIHFETRPTNTAAMYIFVEPVADNKDTEIASADREKTDTDGLDRNPETQLKYTDVVQPTQAESSTEVLGMVLTVRSKINDKYVDRVSALDPDDDWLLESSLTEITDASKVLNIYNMLVQRRRRAFENVASTPDDKHTASSTVTKPKGDGNADSGDSPSKQTKHMSLFEALHKSGSDNTKSSTAPRRPDDGYIRKLKALSLRGRILRRAQLNRERGEVKVVLGQTSDKSSSPGNAVGQRRLAAAGRRAGAKKRKLQKQAKKDPPAVAETSNSGTT